ncbi:hypothetical protein [Haliscomenobacter sp.]|uniref:hypothetical protein n=1 Tax=Haliscomenobacter sp. TaxID=2717303 RepID=UPI003BA8A1CC
MLKSILQIGAVFALFATVLFTACQKEDLVVSEDNFTLGDPLLGQGPRGPRDTTRCCFEFVFPISVELPNGDTLVIDGERQHKNFIERWKNSSLNGRPKIIFPIEVTLADGSNTTLNSPEELKKLIESCLPDRPSLKPCYKVIFPVQVKLPNDSTITINSADAFAALLKRWRDKHPNADRHPQIVIPYQVEKADGTIVRISGADDLRKILAECKPGPDRPSLGHDPRPCFRIVFPDTIQHPDGSTAIAQDAEDFAKQALAWRRAHPAANGATIVKIPFGIVYRDSTTAVIASAEDLRKANAKCGIDPTPCFDVIFPAKVKLPSGVVVEIRSADAFRDLIERWVKNNPLSTDRPELVFPYRVKTKNGRTVVLNDKEDLRKLLANCK